MNIEELQKIESEIESLRKRKIELLSEDAKKDITEDYEFTTPEGNKIKLSEMFGNNQYLFTIHNMGKGCSYCTMWADGMKGMHGYIEKKGAFYLVSPDSPQTHKEFKESRNWDFKSVSSQGNNFMSDMGYYSKENGYYPGVSVFEKTSDGKIKRISKDYFGPGDFYCNVWHFYDLLPTENITINS
ncbi:MAG TPA: hypothetical protein DEP28_00595 [Bacteroidetes bacterium]|nr:hypothetical protein [Bacteroidota bacterium]HCN36388.1 hypothetical protein [Bacteroidota bacterium]